MQYKVLIVTFFLAFNAGCSSIGPPTVSRDRFDYVVAISESVKRQMLLNLVKTRYLDAPVYMDIASVISQYTIEGELGFEFAPSFSDNNLILGNGKYADRPTITYSPLTGEKYSRSLLKPLPLSAVALLLQSGYPVDGIIRVCVQSLNGNDNNRNGALSAREESPHFNEVLSLLRDLQQIGSLYFRVGTSGDRSDIKLGFRIYKQTEAVQQEIQLKRLLGLDPKAKEYSLVYGVQPVNNSEIAMQTRSMMQIMIEYAAEIDVPKSDVDEGRVMKTISSTIQKDGNSIPLISVHSGPTQPEDVHTAVYYRDNWFWIDDKDIYSKSSFNFLMVLFSLTERGQESSQVPIVTVPTN